MFVFGAGSTSSQMMSSLSVLGSSDPTSIQEHSLKLFDNCGSLKFARGNKVVTGMISSEVCQL